ncbi:GNAT family N-acetyltransferase [bacterium]|nr:GNAT family N-acetyltransferase [bacterium]
MTDGDSRVIRLEHAQKIQALDIIVRALWDDPLSRYIYPDENERARKIIHFFDIGFQYSLAFGEVYTTTETDGVAVWLVPEHPDMKLWGMVRTGVFLKVMRMGRKAFGRFNEFMKYAVRKHAESVTGDHWYLIELAVEPACQGRGIGGRLIEPVLERADAAGQPCYLETLTERSVRFYEKHGFTVSEKVFIPDGVPPFWAMIREPR